MAQIGDRVINTAAGTVSLPGCDFGVVGRGGWPRRKTVRLRRAGGAGAGAAAAAGAVTVAPENATGLDEATEEATLSYSLHEFGLVESSDIRVHGDR